MVINALEGVERVSWRASRVPAAARHFGTGKQKFASPRGSRLPGTQLGGEELMNQIQDETSAAAAQAAQPGPSAYLLASSAPRDVALSADSLTLYAAGKDGVLRAYSMSTGQLIGSWTIGKQLGGIDLSPDGTFLMIAEEANLAAPGSGITLASYRFEIATQAVHTYSMAATDYTSGLFFDVAVL